MARIVISEYMDERVLAALRPFHDVAYDPDLHERAGRLLSLVSTCDGLIVRDRTQVRGEVLEALGQCRVVAVLDAYLNNIDVGGCETRRIQVLAAAESNARCVAEFALGAAMLLLRGAFAPTCASALRRQSAGRTIGIVGMSPAGRMLAYLAGNVGMKVVAFDPAMDPLRPAFPVAGVSFAGIDEVLRGCEVVSLLLPPTVEYLGIIDQLRIGEMKPGAVIVAPLGAHMLEIPAVASALKSRRLGGVALDAQRDTPVTGLEECPNVLLGWSAGISLECEERIAALVSERLAGATAQTAAHRLVKLARSFVASRF